MILRKMKRDEHLLTRPLWEKTFHEDSREFLDYYYKDKTSVNAIYVIETDGEIRSMLHLNPYILNVGTRMVESNYIVAVATDSYYRSRGYMTELLKKSVRDMYIQKIPFTFLMPANEKIYYPHNFRFVYTAKRWKVSGLKKSYSEGNITIRVAEPVDCKRIAEFVDAIVTKEYNVCTKRDWLYYENSLREQKSMNGGILLAEVDGQICGTVFFEEEGPRVTVREPLFAEGYERVFETCGMILEEQDPKQMIMARVIYVEELFNCMRCSDEMDLQFVLVDPVIKENNKLFIIKGNSERIVVRTKPWVRGKYDNIQKISIDALTTILFGYKSLEAIEEEEQETFSEEFKEAVLKLDPLNKVFINEIV